MTNDVSLSSSNSSKENVAPQRQPKITSEVTEDNTDKLKLSKAQFQRRKKKTFNQL